MYAGSAQQTAVTTAAAAIFTPGICPSIDGNASLARSAGHIRTLALLLTAAVVREYDELRRT